MTNQKIDQKKEYPMGGEYLEKAKTTSEFFSNLRSVFIKRGPKKEIIDRLKALLSLEESDD